METDWELHYGMGMGMETPAGFSAAAPAYMYSGGMPSAAETLRVDDLLDFTNNELFPSSSSSSSSPAADAHLLAAQEFSSSAAAGNAFGFDAVNSSYSNYPCRHSSFTDDIYIPSEEVAELEWLSQFVEESFSDVPYPNYLAEKIMWQDGNSIHQARSQRSRDLGAASSSSSSASELPTMKGKANASSRKKLQVSAEAAGIVDYGGVRRCTHCASEKTPQWRTGPLGPKTLCNACGVRFKSGRLVPEYRPAASPTFVLTQHSNSHRKVVELRRQKELLILHRNENDASAAALPELLP